MTMSSSTTGQGGLVQKHRACDECRIRKLACTKEPDGCSRCRRENIPCHYSPQKTMGRPRKRPREEPDERPLAAAPPTKTTMTEQPPDTEDPGLEFVNLLLGNDLDLDFDHPVQPGTRTQIHTQTTTTTEAPVSMRYHPWDYTSFGEVNFDSEPVDHAQIFSTNIDPALFISSGASEPPPTEVPALSPTNSNTTNSPESTGPAVATSSVSNCDCTTSLYSALDWMRKLPTEVEPAIRQARLAAKTAYEVVNCTQCGSQLPPTVQHQVGSPAMMQSYQNMMLLATLIPSIVHAYARILTVVDEETNRAVAERRKIAFKLNGFGGIWGRLGGDDEEWCGAQRNFSYREMEPVMWRLTVRALLKIDVYGISGCGNSSPDSDPFHLGLKDIVLLMENKAKARHALMDTMVDAGVWQKPNCFLGAGNPGEPPTCQRVIAIARTSVEQLYIP